MGGPSPCSIGDLLPWSWSTTLYRPILPALVSVVADGGVLLYETYAAGNEQFGKPSRPEFLLQPGELLEAVRGRLRVVAFEDLTLDQPRPAAVQRIVAVREARP